MNSSDKKKVRFSPAYYSGIFFITISVILSFYGFHIAVIPLIIFLFICFIAPFFSRFGFYLPIISHGISNKRAVALTFDDGPDPEVTPKLIQLLSKHLIKATFYVIGEKVLKYPDIIKNILQEGHTIGNHSYSHDPILMLRRSAVLSHEIKSTQEILFQFGIKPLTFRPPVGITNPKLGGVLNRLGMYCVNFSCQALDMGNRHIKGLSGRILKRVKLNNIILLHDVMPKNNFELPVLLNEIELILTSLKDDGVQILPLSELINRPVMKYLNCST